jgi:hypothetical protein
MYFIGEGHSSFEQNLFSGFAAIANVQTVAIMGPLSGHVDNLSMLFSVGDGHASHEI